MLVENDDLTPLERQYVEAAVEHARHSLSDADMANLAHDRIVAAFKELQAFGEPGWSIIRRLTAHEDVSVRLWSATHLLLRDPDAAVEVLEGLATEPDMTGFQAENVLSEWRAGTLRWA